MVIIGKPKQSRSRRALSRANSSEDEEGDENDDAGDGKAGGTEEESDGDEEENEDDEEDKEENGDDEDVFCLKTERAAFADSMAMSWVKRSRHSKTKHVRGCIFSKLF